MLRESSLGVRMKIRITVTVPNGEPVITHVEVSEDGDTANAIRDALDLARRQNPDCLISNSDIKLERRGDA